MRFFRTVRFSLEFVLYTENNHYCRGTETGWVFSRNRVNVFRRGSSIRISRSRRRALYTWPRCVCANHTVRCFHRENTHLIANTVDVLARVYRTPFAVEPGGTLGIPTWTVNHRGKNNAFTCVFYYYWNCGWPLWLICGCCPRKNDFSIKKKKKPEVWRPYTAHK